jgi:hypothetical protein
MAEEGLSKLVKYLIVIAIFVVIVIIFFGGYGPIKDKIIQMTDSQINKLQGDRDHIAPQDALDRVDPEIFKKNLEKLGETLKNAIASDKEKCIIKLEDITKEAYPGLTGFASIIQTPGDPELGNNLSLVIRNNGEDTEIFIGKGWLLQITFSGVEGTTWNYETRSYLYNEIILFNQRNSQIRIHEDMRYIYIKENNLIFGAGMIPSFIKENSNIKC